MGILLLVVKIGAASSLLTGLGEERRKNVRRTFIHKLIPV